jgi:hypothetical protein
MIAVLNREVMTPVLRPAYTVLFAVLAFGVPGIAAVATYVESEDRASTMSDQTPHYLTTHGRTFRDLTIYDGSTCNAAASSNFNLAVSSKCWEYSGVE